MTGLIHPLSAHILQTLREHFTRRAQRISALVGPADEISTNPLLKNLHTKIMERKNGKTPVTTPNT